MKVGDLVKNLNSESRMHGVVVDFELRRAGGGFYWSDGRCSPIVMDMVAVVR